MSAANFLEKIVAKRRRELPAAAETRELRATVERAPKTRASHRLRSVLATEGGIHIIAEFKRASPSCGPLKVEAKIADLIPIYERGGASAVSILTEPTFFRGGLEDLREARTLTSLPLLRKDFTVAESQIDEAFLAGADAILLIVAALSDAELTHLRKRAEEELGLDALVEVHTAAEMKRARSCGAKLIGVNNRDLQTLTTSLQTSEELAALAPRDATLISESGLSSPADLERLHALGYAGFLIGESLMRSLDPLDLLQSLRGRGSARPQLKICGVTNTPDALRCGQLGVEMIGLNFSSVSPRCISVEDAKQILEATRAEYPALKFAGVFVDQEAAWIEKITRALKLEAVQLHGDESPTYVRALRAPFVIKALPVDDAFSPALAETFSADAILLDAPGGRGGTGRSFDWARAKIPTGKRLFLAGGITPQNVLEAIDRVRPFAIDVCSGVEESPGKKNPAKLERLVAAMRNSPTK